jgi:hypothetical protein
MEAAHCLGKQARPTTTIESSRLKDGHNRWEAPIDDETVAEKIAFSHWHETYHVGQLELLRQLAGKNDKVI